MNRTECLKALELLQSVHVRCAEYQNHQPGRIHADNPWAIMARDKHNLGVHFDNYDDLAKWVYHYWLNPIA